MIHTSGLTPSVVLDSLSLMGWSLVYAEVKPGGTILVNSESNQVLVICPEEWDILRADSIEDAGRKLLVP